MLILLWNDVFACCTKAFAEVNCVCDGQKINKLDFFLKKKTDVLDCGLSGCAGLQKYYLNKPAS
jgi:hypothetical protein